jgi:Concanavalin A-like lectin/glucanases superfamily
MKMPPLRRCFALSLTLGLSLASASAQPVGPGNAVDFNGASQYAQAPSDTYFTGDFTIEGWVFLRSYNSWSRLIDFSDGPNTNVVYLALSAGTSGQPAMGVFTVNNGTPLIQASSQIPTNQWVHFAATSKTNLGTIYVNGSPVIGGTLNATPNVLRTNCYIGRSAYPGDAYANAKFDEIRIWNVARSQAQIQGSMHRLMVGNESGLIAYWRMDEASGSALTDLSGNGHVATLQGAVRTNSTAPITASAGSAITVGGTSGTPPWAQVPHNAALDAYPLTAMCWFQDPPGGGGGALLNKYVSSSLNGYQIFLDGGGGLNGWYYANSGSKVTQFGAGSVADNLWHHAALTVDSSGGKLYVDGILKGSNSWAGTPGPVTTTQPVSFGLYPGDSFWSGGQVDEASIWNVALTQAQIQHYMTNSPVGNEPGLVADWRFNEASGTNYLDSGPNNLTAYGINNPPWSASGALSVAPDPGYGLVFNGSNYADASTFSTVMPTNEITIEFWQKCAVLQNQSSLSMSPDNVNNRINVHCPWSDGNVYWDFGNINANGRLEYVPTNSVVGQWEHFVFEVSQSQNFMVIFRNDQMVAYTNTMSRVTNNGQHLIIGAIPGGVYFNGAMDEVRIWNYVRTPQQLD